jgi:CHASE2 domain-containing sensor protein
VAQTVLIAAPEHLPALKEHGFADALAFSDADALKALEAITREKPRVIALEKLFASTSRGAALIKRIKADPSLTGCEINIVAHDGTPLTAQESQERRRARREETSSGSSAGCDDSRGAARSARHASRAAVRGGQRD